MLAEMPVADVTLTELSRRVGLAKSNVLRYFESREAVLLDLLGSQWQEWLPAPAGEPARAKGPAGPAAARGGPAGRRHGPGGARRGPRRPAGRCPGRLAELQAGAVRPGQCPGRRAGA